MQYIKYKTDNFERSERNQFYILYARGFHKIFYNNKLLLKFIYIINSLSIIPDPFQIIELTVFSIKNMHDHITEVNQYPCSASVSFCLFCSVALLCASFPLHSQQVHVPGCRCYHLQLQNSLQVQIPLKYQSHIHLHLLSSNASKAIFAISFA